LTIFTQRMASASTVASEWWAEQCRYASSQRSLEFRTAYL